METKHLASHADTVLTPQVQLYVVRYNTSLKKTVESILGLAHTLVEAEAELDPVDFSTFCDEVGLTKGSPIFSKLKKIGDNVSRFDPFVQQLPNAWTTLYDLARLDANTFDRIAPLLSPFSSAKEVRELVGKESKISNKDDISLNLAALDGLAKSEVYTAIKSLKEKFNFQFKPSNKLVEEVKLIKTMNI